MRAKDVLVFLGMILFLSCSGPAKKTDNPKVPIVAFLEAFEDPTITRARQGFFDALKSHGYSAKNGTLKVIYKNAEGNPGTMNLAVSYILSRHPDLVATSTTVSTLAVCQRTRSVPVFMMVSPNPKDDGLTGIGIEPHTNLYGVYEDVDYIDTAIRIIPAVIPHARKIAAIYSQSESQSALGFQRLQETCAELKLTLDALPVNSSAETRLVVQKLMSGHPDAFFALPDNSVFASFETIRAVCLAAHVPVFTSEEGLVDRGALAAFGADIYGWGYQTGLEASAYLTKGPAAHLTPVRVQLRKSVYNRAMAAQLGIKFPPLFKALGGVTDKRGLPSRTSKTLVTSLWLDALITGLCLAFLAFGIYFSLRIFQIPDITTDGSFTLGAVITSICLVRHINPWLVLPLAFAGGAAAGSITGFISTRFAINALLAGILVMTGMYSVNLWLLGRANRTIESGDTLSAKFDSALDPSLTALVLITGLVVVMAFLLTRFLKTDFGISMRATGSSPVMARSVGVETKSMQVTGLALANGLTGIAGSLVSQFQGFVDISMGTGIVITGLGSVLIGDSLANVFKIGTTGLRLGLIITGSIVFQLLVAAALSAGVDPLWIRLITSLLVLAVVIIPKLFK